MLKFFKKKLLKNSIRIDIIAIFWFEFNQFTSLSLSMPQSKHSVYLSRFGTLKCFGSAHMFTFFFSFFFFFPSKFCKRWISLWFTYVFSKWNWFWNENVLISNTFFFLSSKWFFWIGAFEFEFLNHTFLLFYGPRWTYQISFLTLLVCREMRICYRISENNGNSVRFYVKRFYSTDSMIIRNSLRNWCSCWATSMAHKKNVFLFRWRHFLFTLVIVASWRIFLSLFSHISFRQTNGSWRNTFHSQRSFRRGYEKEELQFSTLFSLFQSSGFVHRCHWTRRIIQLLFLDYCLTFSLFAIRCCFSVQRSHNFITWRKSGLKIVVPMIKCLNINTDI